MTTDQIEQAANRGDIATGDMNLKMILRRSVVPQFLEDVGRVSWRRKTTPINTVIGDRKYALPTDFVQAHGVYLPTDYDNSLKYIGEDPDRLARAESNVTNGAPTGYYITQNTSGTAAWQSLALEAPASAVLALRVVYYFFARFADDSTAVDMAQHIPEQFHFGLVEGLRMEIFLDRFGQGDPRYVAVEGKYQSWVARASGRRELGTRNYANFVR